MAVGVPEHEVFAAADRVLARGERPTVERVRAELGRGSPARVGQLLESWWDALAKRLAGHAALPDVPLEVAAAFQHVWATASAHAQTQAEGLVAPERAALAEAVARTDAALVGERAAKDAAVQAAYQAQERSETLVAEIARLQGAIEQQVATATDRDQRLAEAVARGERLEAALANALRARDAERAAAVQERDTLHQHIRQTENRAAREIDRAREEAKTLKRDLGIAQRERAVAVSAAQTALRAQHAAEKRAATLEARISRPTPRSPTRGSLPSRASKPAAGRAAAERPRTR